MIRRYQAGDEEAIARIYLAAIDRLACADYTRVQREAWAGHGPDIAGWRRRCEKKRPFVNVIAGEVAGFMELDPDGHIDRTFVDPAFSRQGVMSGLMAAVKDEAGRQGIRRLFAEVSITARPFFERHGFRWVRDNLVTIRGVELRNFVMDITLPEPPAAD